MKAAPMTFIEQLQPPVLAALIGATATCLASVIGFTAVFVQIGRQGRNAIIANQFNEALKRKVEIYELTLGTTRKAQEATTALSNYLRMFGSEVDICRDMEELGLVWRVPRARYPEYSRLNLEASEAVISVMGIIEAWHIIEPKLDVFRLAFGLGLDGLRQVSNSDSSSLIPAMPVQDRESQWEIPSGALRANMENQIEKQIYQAGRLSAWIADFQTEMQILLLSELFPNRVERRDPPDQEQFCIRLDRYNEIIAKINASDYGRRMIELEAEAWHHFSSGVRQKRPPER